MIGSALRDLGQPEEAIGALRRAIRLKPDFAEAHANLGMALRALGRYAEATEELRKGVHLLSGQSYAGQIDAACRETERMAALDARLPAVLRGEERPLGEEAVEFANLCFEKQLYASSARLFEGAFEADPGGLELANRYDAACSAALAGSGKGRDDPPPDAAARANLRRKALAWLRAEVRARSEALGRAGLAPAERGEAVRLLGRCKEDPDLAGVRAAEALATLPEAERDEWRALWSEVDGHLDKTERPN